MTDTLTKDRIEDLETCAFGLRATVDPVCTGLRQYHTDVAAVARELLAARQRISSLELQIQGVRHLVDRQAEDVGLWFQATTAPEAYLQQELRKLHAAIEGKS